MTAKLEPSTQNPGSTTPEEIMSWLETGASATQESFLSPGVGQDVRIEREDVLGASLVVNDHPVHMELFRRTEARAAQARGRFDSEPEQPTSTEGPAPKTGSRPGSWLRRIFS